MGVLQLVRASLHRMRSTSHLVCRMGGRVARLVQRVRGGMPHLVCRMGGVVPRLFGRVHLHAAREPELHRLRAALWEEF